MSRRYGIACVVGALLVFGLVGCEWEEAGEGGTWDDSVSWVNFSGVYRGAGPNGCIATAHGSWTPTTTSGDSSPIRYKVVNETVSSVTALQTKFSGRLAHTPIESGSVTLVFKGTSSQGTARDQGGTFAVTFNLVGVDTPRQGSGTIDYNTGVWTIDLVSPGYLENMSATASYIYTSDPNLVLDGGSAGGEDGTATANPCTFGIYTLQISQMGNQISMKDSKGVDYKGYLSLVSSAGGDTRGMTSGEIIAEFVVEGNNCKIVGTLQGDYTAPASGGSRGRMTNRMITGTLLQGKNTADVLGRAGTTTLVIPTGAGTGTAGTGGTTGQTR